MESGYEIGERYVLQYASGPERLARVERHASGGQRLSALDGPALPDLPPAARWLIGPREQLLRDPDGRYWRIGSRATSRGGAGWSVVFERFTVDGEAQTAYAEAAADPSLLPEGELAALLHAAWGEAHSATGFLAAMHASARNGLRHLLPSRP